MSDLHVTHHLTGAKLGPKLGPFPVAVWVLIIGAGLYVAHRRSASMAASTSASTDTTTTDPSSVPAGASNSVPLDPVGVAGSSDNAGAPVSSFTPVNVTDNMSWQSAAITALVKAGVTPITANNAVDKYLSGDVLTADEAHAVNVAIGLVGPPPEGAPPVTVMATPAAPVTTTPPPPRPSASTDPAKPASTTKAHKPSKGAPRPTRGGRVTVHPGDTLYGIAAAHHLAESQLYAANRSTIESAAKRHGRSSSESGHWIFPGTVLVLP